MAVGDRVATRSLRDNDAVTGIRRRLIVSQAVAGDRRGSRRGRSTATVNSMPFALTTPAALLTNDTLLCSKTFADIDGAPSRPNRKSRLQRIRNAVISHVDIVGAAAKDPKIQLAVVGSD
jgi:hypothetical protein